MKEKKKFEKCNDVKLMQLWYGAVLKKDFSLR